MPVGQPIDRNTLHRLLFRRADRFGKLKIKLKDLATELDLGYANLSVVVGQMVDEGRLSRLGGHKYGTKTYVVTDPVEWGREPVAPAGE